MSKKEKNQETTEQQNNNNINNEENTQQECSCGAEDNKCGEQTDENNNANLADNGEQLAKEWQDKYARLSAEFDNFRKRTLKEKMDLVENGGAEVLRLMLQTADDFDRALQHIADEETKSGIELIYNKFLGSLRSKGVEEMDLKGKPFDVDYAEAIAKFPATSPELSGTIMDVAEKGYMIKDKVLRFAKVVVFE